MICNIFGCFSRIRDLKSTLDYKTLCFNYLKLKLNLIKWRKNNVQPESITISCRLIDCSWFLACLLVEATVTIPASWPPQQLQLAFRLPDPPSDHPRLLHGPLSALLHLLRYHELLAWHRWDWSSHDFCQWAAPVAAHCLPCLAAPSAYQATVRGSGPRILCHLVSTGSRPSFATAGGIFVMELVCLTGCLLGLLCFHLAWLRFLQLLPTYLSIHQLLSYHAIVIRSAA